MKENGGVSVNPGKKKINYMWVMVFVCFMLGFFCLGFCSGNKSLYLAAITEALGIKRSLFSFSDSIRYLSTAGVNLFFGSLLHKLGVRKMVMLGILSLAIQSVLNAVATDIWGFYAAGVFLGIGLAFCTTTMISFVIRRWCKENTGKILGFVLAANGIGAAVAAQVVSPIIYNPENPFGYRIAYLIMAACLVVVAVIVVPLIKERPDDSGPMQMPKKQDKAKSRDWVGMDFSQAKKKAYFYAAAVCIFATGMCLQALSGISAAHMKDVGMDPDYVARVVSLQALIMACTKFLAGVSYDKFGMRVTMTICDVAAVLSAVMLTLVSTTPMGMIMAILYAALIAIGLRDHGLFGYAPGNHHAFPFCCRALRQSGIPQDYGHLRCGEYRRLCGGQSHCQLGIRCLRYLQSYYPVFRRSDAGGHCCVPVYFECSI